MVDAEEEMLDMRICQLCPLGPEPFNHLVCKRCVADVDAVTMRRHLLDKQRAKFTYDEVDYSAALLYDLLPNLLPNGDPACG